MTKKLQKALLILICININFAFAERDKIFPNKLNHCNITKSHINDYEPANFQTTNNLLRSTGEHLVYCGGKIIITGKVLDQNCVPVSDAKVYLWQVGCDGKYPYYPLRNRINKKMLNLSNGSSFTGSGIATTNNEGEFHFITIYPPSTTHEKSNVNIRVEHRNLGTLQTKFYLLDSNILTNDTEINPILSTIIEDATVYNFNIIMPGQTLKRY